MRFILQHRQARNKNSGWRGFGKTAQNDHKKRSSEVNHVRDFHGFCSKTHHVRPRTALAGARSASVSFFF